MIHEKVCAYIHCQKPFQTTYRSQQCCSRPCALRHKHPHTPEGIRAYLLKNADISDSPDGHWLWKGHIATSGYGIACFLGQHSQAHRASYEFFVGPIPTGMHILHARHCPHRHCINPRHLYAGTNTENIADKVALNRTPHGASHCHARLTESDVLKILQLYHAPGSTHNRYSLAKLFGVSEGSIKPILERKTWKHVAPGEYPYVSRHPHLTEDNVRTLRQRYANGWPVIELARIYHLTDSQVYNIVNRKSWAHIE